MKLNNKEIDVEYMNELPEEEGTYLWKSIDSIQVIKVLYYPAKEEYGTRWNAYYGVSTFRGKHISQLKGKFVKIEM